jgi:uncharacterized short protein YbdD (DUF466 family)
MDKRGGGAAGCPAAPLSRRLASAIRRLSGMPDYACYVEHMRRCHPERPVLSERLFYEDFVRARYADGPTRCC